MPQSVLKISKTSVKTRIEGRKTQGKTRNRGGRPAEDSQRSRNWRAEAFWKLREAMEKGELSLPDDEDLRADLSTLRYTFTQDDRIQIEGKDECRKRLARFEHPDG